MRASHWLAPYRGIPRWVVAQWGISHWSWDRPLMVLTTLACVSFPGCVSAPYGTPESNEGQIPPGETVLAGTPSASGQSAASDSANGLLVPAGFGSLRQDDLSLHVDGPGVLIRALPLDESVIRLLTPDSYRSMRDLKESNKKSVDSIARRYGVRSVSVWFVSFYGVEPEARFAPMELTVMSGGRDFRPYDAIPLTTGFNEQRLRQRETQNALYVFDGDIQLNQPIVVTYQSDKDETWETTLQRIERERVLIRARARKSQ